MNPHQQRSISPVEIARSFWRNRGLIWPQAVERYRGFVMCLQKTIKDLPMSSNNKRLRHDAAARINR
jgi:hypothetical protein